MTSTAELISYVGQVVDAPTWTGLQQRARQLGWRLKARPHSGGLRLVEIHGRPMADQQDPPNRYPQQYPNHYPQQYPNRYPTTYPAPSAIGVGPEYAARFTGLLAVDEATLDPAADYVINRHTGELVKWTGIWNPTIHGGDDA